MPRVFLTGATGFLGAFILRDLLDRKEPQVSVIALVRAKTAASAVLRVEATCRAYGIWSDSWRSRLECVPGTLGEHHFGMTDADFDSLCDTTEIVSTSQAKSQADPQKRLVWP
jgi:L-aminoadipate-semialdehyde dehydrogenase